MVSLLFQFVDVIYTFKALIQHDLYRIA